MKAAATGRPSRRLVKMEPATHEMRTEASEARGWDLRLSGLIITRSIMRQLSIHQANS